MNEFDLMEKRLVDAMVETMKKQDILLSDENITYFIKVALSSIIRENRYNCFTHNNGARDGLKEFIPSDFIRLLFDRMDSYYGRKDIVKKDVIFKNHDGRNFIDYRKLQKYINTYAEEVFPGAVGEELFDKKTIVDSSYFDKLREKISNKFFYKPSDEVRRVILSGEQTSVKKSSVKINGMQAYSDVGKVRKNQEDSYYIGSHPKNNEFKLLLVADGMGGHESGEVASNIAAKEMMKFFDSLPVKEFYNEDNRFLIDEINKKLIDIDKEIKRVTSNGGTTLCFAIIKDKDIIVGNVGDSRGVVMENGRLIYSTISQSLPALEGIPEPFDRFHPRSNVIYNSLGNFQDGYDRSQVAEFDTIKMSDNKDYDILLCSDGVSDCLSNDRIVEIANSSLPDMVAENIVEGALRSYSDFGYEYEMQYRKVIAGITSVSDWNRINEALSYGNLNCETAKKIIGGKDNTTAVSGKVSRKR